MSAKDVLQTIAAYAFKTSDYPLILSFENHCNPKQQVGSLGLSRIEVRDSKRIKEGTCTKMSRILGSEPLTNVSILLLSVVNFKMPTTKKVYVSFSYYPHFEGTRFIYTFFTDKVIKKFQNSRNQGVSYYFCVMMEGTGFGPLTNIREAQKLMVPDH
jgi:hypothetical protein